MECPNIKKNMEDKFNILVNYKDLGGPVDYLFYDHTDAYWNIVRVQFCKKIGRKQDVFQCLNEEEWKHCPHYEESRQGELR